MFGYLQIQGNNSLFTCWCGDGGLEERKPLKGEIKLASTDAPLVPRRIVYALQVQQQVRLLLYF